MPVLRSSINTKSETFIANAEHMQAQVNDLLEKLIKFLKAVVKKLHSVIYLEENYCLVTVLMH